VNRTLRLALEVAAVALATAVPAGAQILPDSPRMTGVLDEPSLGVYYLRPSALPGDDVGVLATWQPTFLPETVRFRFGGGTGAADQTAGLGGIDVRIPLRNDSDRLQLAWTTGIGASFGEWGIASLPIGLTVGAVYSEGAVTLAPWAGVGVGFDLQFGDEAPDEDFEVRPAVDFGLDLSFDRARRIRLRTGVSVGDRNALAVGLAIG
jgi:hypothetical protein